LRVLEAIAADERTTQRRLAEQLGIALGLANLYLKRLAHKGYIKCINVRPNRVLYLITPTGIAEKTRLTYEFMDYSLRMFRESRRHLTLTLRPYAAKPAARIAIYGTGEGAELAYLCLKELDLEPVAVFGDKEGGTFLGVPLVDVADHKTVAFDLLIVASMERDNAPVKELVARGIPRQRMLTLRPMEDAPLG
jgi:DNA-binding MarR family transcriptional regulator